jgi:hypothetical protein
MNATLVPAQRPGSICLNGNVTLSRWHRTIASCLSIGGRSGVAATPCRGAAFTRLPGSSFSTTVIASSNRWSVVGMLSARQRSRNASFEVRPQSRPDSLTDDCQLDGGAYASPNDTSAANSFVSAGMCSASLRSSQTRIVVPNYFSERSSAPVRRRIKRISCSTCSAINGTRCWL